MKTLVVVPAYNEEGAIEGVVRDLRDHFPEGDILVVNDGSKDRTPDIARSMGVAVIDLPYNVGIGGAMQTGFMFGLAEGYETVIQFDGDGQHNAEEIPIILGPYLDGRADLVVGSRFLHETGFTPSVPRRLGSKILSFIVSTLVRKRITDTTSGFRVYGRKALDFFASFYPEDYPEVETLILAHKKGLRIEEVPVRMSPRIAGKSSITVPKAVYYMIKVVLAISIDLLKKID
jgi:hypothetical protein